MTMPKKILLLHDAPEAPPAVAELAQELQAGGAEVRLAPCAEPYGGVLDAVAEADSVVYFR